MELTESGRECDSERTSKLKTALFSQDTGAWILELGSWSSDLVILDLGSGIPRPSRQILEIGRLNLSEIETLGSLKLGDLRSEAGSPGSWSLELGSWSLELGSEIPQLSRRILEIGTQKFSEIVILGTLKLVDLDSEMLLFRLSATETRQLELRPGLKSAESHRCPHIREQKVCVSPSDVSSICIRDSEFGRQQLALFNWLLWSPKRCCSPPKLDIFRRIDSAPSLSSLTSETGKPWLLNRS